MPVNMVKAEMNTSGGLDTTFVAKNVRELLAVHNIGQRLFAKHVLGLSQGTVSELLSKPKSWDKLTEKGRESYRKMHAWATDDANILALKAMSPKKSESPVFLVNVFSAFLFFIFNTVFIVRFQYVHTVTLAVILLFIQMIFKSKDLCIMIVIMVSMCQTTCVTSLRRAVLSCF